MIVTHLLTTVCVSVGWAHPMPMYYALSAAEELNRSDGDNRQLIQAQKRETLRNTRGSN